MTNARLPVSLIMAMCPLFSLQPARAQRTPASTVAWPAAKPCPPPAHIPKGMACVHGGVFQLGDARGRREERQPGKVFVDTFLMDTHEVTTEAYESCIEQGVCREPKRYRRYSAPRQPMVAVSWFDAVKYCEHLSKRLPTEAQWERAASGPDDTTYPWGNEPATCERAIIKDRRGEGCGRGVTWKVGSRPAGHWGLFDMAGNVHEWVQDWYSPCLTGCPKACGKACFGVNPKGPCGGARKCPGRRGLRSVRGGSWYWPGTRARASARRGSGAPNRGPHRFGFRCAKDISP